jgi:tetratricopeptide (TPR) repeat protein
MHIHPEIKKAIENRKLVFFIGAGFSHPLGLPDWSSFVKAYVNKYKTYYPGDPVIQDAEENLNNKINTPIEILDALKTTHYARIVTFLEETIKQNFKDKDLSRHKILWQITRQIITTNYDKALETADETVEAFSYSNNFQVGNLAIKDEYLYKAHGNIDNPAECILFSQQYEKLYAKDNGAMLSLFQLLTGKTIIFLGFSLSDPYVKELLMLRQKAYANIKLNHFIISTDEDAIFNELGVERIQQVSNYDNELNAFIEELSEISKAYDEVLEKAFIKACKDNPDLDKQEFKKRYNMLYQKDLPNGLLGLDENELQEKFDAAIQNVNEEKALAAEAAYMLANIKQAADLQPENRKYVSELSKILFALNENDRAIEYAEKAIKIDIKQLGEDHPKIAISFNNSGEILRTNGEFGRAIEFYNKALAIESKKNVTPAAINTGIYYNNLALAYKGLYEYESAIEYFDKAIDVFDSNLPLAFPYLKAVEKAKSDVLMYMSKK